ncbi:hypothetical protein B5F40_00455 [Gordonibacter sp. An230]|nr:hypothetical protein B5F40_00455 [Gordonibacter sp. An230]
MGGRPGLLCSLASVRGNDGESGVESGIVQPMLSRAGAAEVRRQKPWREALSGVRVAGGAWRGRR